MHPTAKGLHCEVKMWVTHRRREILFLTVCCGCAHGFDAGGRGSVMLKLTLLVGLAASVTGHLNCTGKTDRRLHPVDDA